MDPLPPNPPGAPPAIPPNPPPLPVAPPTEGFNWKRVILDVLMVFLFTFVGGFIVGVVTGATGAGMKSPAFALGIAISNLAMTTIAFTISACRAPDPRWQHLFVVALLSWAAGLINLLFGVKLVHWVFSIFAILLTMAAGGALSYAFRPHSPNQR
jgi:hypothetical protein